MSKPKEERKEWEGYSVESLHRAIRAAEVNIITFQDAIKQERETMANYKWMIEQIERKKIESIAAKIAQEAVNKDIARQNAEHIAKYPNLKSVEVTKEEEEDGDSS